MWLMTRLSRLIFERALILMTSIFTVSKLAECVAVWVAAPTANDATKSSSESIPKPTLQRPAASPLNEQ